MEARGSFEDTEKRTANTDTLQVPDEALRRGTVEVSGTAPAPTVPFESEEKRALSPQPDDAKYDAEAQAPATKERGKPKKKPTPLVLAPKTKPFRPSDKLTAKVKAAMSNLTMPEILLAAMDVLDELYSGASVKMPKNAESLLTDVIEAFAVSGFQDPVIAVSVYLKLLKSTNEVLEGDIHPYQLTLPTKDDVLIFTQSTRFNVDLHARAKEFTEYLLQVAADFESICRTVPLVDKSMDRTGDGFVRHEDIKALKLMELEEIVYDEAFSYLEGGQSGGKIHLADFMVFIEFVKDPELEVMSLAATENLSEIIDLARVGAVFLSVDDSYDVKKLGEPQLTIRGAKDILTILREGFDMDEHEPTEVGDNDPGLLYLKRMNLDSFTLLMANCPTSIWAALAGDSS